MKTIGVFWKNGAIVSVVCFLSLPAYSQVQPADNTATNQPPAQSTNDAVTITQPVENAVTPVQPEPTIENPVTNEVSNQGFSTNLSILQTPVLRTYGAQPVPNTFEAQINAPFQAGPTYNGGGQIISPVTGTAVFGVPGFAPTSGQGIYQDGNLNVHANLSYSFLYGSGIQNAPGQHANVVDQVISPGVAVNLGSHFTVNYSAGLSFYSANSGLGDSTGQSASLYWSTFYDDWAFGVSQSYSFSSTPLIETGTQTAEKDYSTGVNISHQLGDGFSLTIGLNQGFRLAEQFNNLYSWSGNASLNYAPNPKLQFGMSLGGGYSEVSDSPSMTSESYSFVVMARPGPKTTVNLSVGLEEQSFNVSGIPTTVSPIYSASINYQLFPHTSIGITGSRSTNPSFFSNLLSTATSVGVSVQQGLTRKLNLSVSGGYGNSSYQTIEPGPLPQYFLGSPTLSALKVTRTDDSTYVGASLSYAFRPHLTGNLGYSYGKNTSSQGLFGYSSSQFSVQLAYQY